MNAASASAATPVVSVVIANHGYVDFVSEAVRSALDQTYSKVEVIVVDDASTDGSVPLLREEFGDRIRVFSLTENVGQVRAIEYGVEQAHGDIVCLLDADDRWLPAKVQRVVDAFEAFPDAIQVSHGLSSIAEDGRAIGSRRRRRRTGKIVRGRARFARRMPLATGNVTDQLFRWNRYGCAITSGLSYRRSALEAMSPMPKEFESRATYFDTWSTVSAAFLGPVQAIEEPLMEYRIHGSNAAGGSTDFERFAACWIMTGRLVDHWAAIVGDDRRAKVEERDNRLALFGYLAGWPVSRRRRVRAVLESPAEAVSIGAGPLEALMKTLERLVMALSRRQGAIVKRVGLYRWIKRFGERSQSRATDDPETT